MGTIIAIGAVALLFSASAYVIAKLDDRLHKEKHTANNLRAELMEAKEKNEWLKVVIEEATQDNRKLNHKLQAVQKDYDLLYNDLLYNDYITLQQENEK